MEAPMPRGFSLAHLAHLGFFDVPPPAIIAVAARAGYQQAGMRLLPAAAGGVAYPLMQDSRHLARINGTSVGVFDLEVIRRDAGFDARQLLALATHLADIAAIPPGRLHYAQMCDAAADIATTRDLICTALPASAAR
jgi:hypothetical protein